MARFTRSCASKPHVIIGDLGDDPPNRTDPRRIPPQDFPPVVGYTTTIIYGGAVIVPTFGGGDGGSSPKGFGDMRPPPREKYTPIHQDLLDIRAEYGCREASRSAGSTGVVISGGLDLEVMGRGARETKVVVAMEKKEWRSYTEVDN